MSPPTPAAVIGANARRVRVGAGVTLEQAATAARKYGLRWDISRITLLESGDLSPGLPTLIALALALSEVTGADVRVHDLVATADPVQVTPALTMTGDALADYLRGVGGRPALDLEALRPGTRLARSVQHNLPASADSQAVAAVVAASIGSTDRNAARTLGVPVAVLTAHALELWGRPLSEERDRRAGSDANRRQKGQVSRELLAELAARLPAPGA